jgi:glycosyltransferase involved in cell wall biosynthesis
MKKKYALIKIRTKHTTIDQLIRILSHTFPEYELEIIEVKALLKAHKLLLFINLLHVINIYGFMTLFENKTIRYNRFFCTPYMYHAIRRLLNQDHSFQYLFTLQDCSLFNGKLDGIPHYVYTDHTVLANKYYPGYDAEKEMLAESWIALERDIYHNADMVFTLSMAIRNSIINDYSCNPQKVECIYYAPFIETRERANSADRYRNKRILFVGIEWERKGGPLLIEAFKRVLTAIPDAHLSIVGCRPDVSVSNVDVFGLVEQDRLNLYYETSSIFCLPTRREPFGIAFIEAMSHSLPVIGTNVGALPEFILDGVNGYRIDIDDVDRLTTLLIELLSDSRKCEEFGREGYNIYCEKYTLKAVSTLLRRHIEPNVTQSGDRAEQIA